MQEFQLSCPGMFGHCHQGTRATNVHKVHIAQVKIFLNTTILTKISFLVVLGTYILYKYNPFFFLEQYASFSICVVLTVALVLLLLPMYPSNFSV